MTNFCRKEQREDVTPMAISNRIQITYPWYSKTEASYQINYLEDK
jgi:hypothetical protein